ncbi:hypothetical protein QTP88_026966 [Uroleucon formosanum]
MPFGLSGAPSTFQRLMNAALTGLNSIKAFVYLDDIIIYAADLTEHESRLEEVFQRLRKFNLRLQPRKCQFLRREVVYLGHLITDSGVKPDPAKISCYRRFIEKYSQIAKPITILLKKGQSFEWTAECQTAFETLIRKLIQAPILQYPNFEEPFILTTDASGYAIGSIISQGREIGQDLPIAYASRTLNKAEQNYSTTEKELLSIVWSVKHFRPYLLGRQFKIYTDHQPLTWLFNVKDPGSRLMRWRIKLSEYQYEVIYKPVNNMVKEEAGDLFDAPSDYSLVTCISQDVKMSHGTALMFRRKFGNVDMLKCQHPKIHEVLYIHHGNRYILYMLNIVELAVPHIGSGLDQLDWSDVRPMIRFVFKETTIKIHIYSLTELKHAEKQKIIAEHHSSLLEGHRGINQTLKRIQT